MEGKNGLVARCIEPEERQVPEGSHVELQVTAPIGRQVLVEPPFPLKTWHAAPVVALELDAHLSMDFLHRLFHVSPAKTRPQDVMAPRHSPPGLLEAVGVQALPQVADDLQSRHPRTWGGQGVDQHALLHGGKRVGRFDAHRFIPRSPGRRPAPG